MRGMMARSRRLRSSIAASRQYVSTFSGKRKRASVVGQSRDCVSSQRREKRLPFLVYWKFAPRGEP